MELPFSTHESCIGSLLFKGKRWLCIIRGDKGRKLRLLSGKSHGIILDTKQTWYQITDIGYKQQDPTVRFPVADVLNEKNARKVTRRVVLKGDKKM